MHRGNLNLHCGHFLMARHAMHSTARQRPIPQLQFEISPQHAGAGFD
jgi:hypothetical protein